MLLFFNKDKKKFCLSQKIKLFSLSLSLSQAKTFYLKQSSATRTGYISEEIDEEYYQELELQQLNQQIQDDVQSSNDPMSCEESADYFRLTAEDEYCIQESTGNLYKYCVLQLVSR